MAEQKGSAFCSRSASYGRIAVGTPAQTTGERTERISGGISRINTYGKLSDSGDIGCVIFEMNMFVNGTREGVGYDVRIALAVSNENIIALEFNHTTG